MIEYKHEPGMNRGKEIQTEDLDALADITVSDDEEQVEEVVEEVKIPDSFVEPEVNEDALEESMLVLSDKL